MRTTTDTPQVRLSRVNTLRLKELVKTTHRTLTQEVNVAVAKYVLNNPQKQVEQ